MQFVQFVTGCNWHNKIMAVTSEPSGLAHGQLLPLTEKHWKS